MKLVFHATFLLCFLVYAQCQQQGKRCYGPGDCAADQCCEASSLDLLYNRGRCRKLKQEGDHCIPQTAPGQNGIYPFACPCLTGLECIMEVIDMGDLGVIHQNPTCHDPDSGSGGDF